MGARRSAAHAAVGLLRAGLAAAVVRCVSACTMASASQMAAWISE